MTDVPRHSKDSVQAHPTRGTEPRPAWRKKLREYSVAFGITVAMALFLKSCVVEAFHIPSASMEPTLHPGDYVLVNKFIYGAKTPHEFPLMSGKLPVVRLPAIKNIRRGDVVVFRFPRHDFSETSPDELNYVKRCIGLPGDTVLIDGGRLFVNGSLFPVVGSSSAIARYGSSAYLREGSAHAAGSELQRNYHGPVVVPAKGTLIELNSENIQDWELFIRREGHTVLRGEGETILIDGHPAQSFTVKRNYLFVVGDNWDNSLDSRHWGFVPEENVIGEVLMIYWSWNQQERSPGILGRWRNARWNRIGTIIR